MMTELDNDDTLAFSALLASKLCHDLLSPVSALLNAVELMEDTDPDPSITEMAQQLISDSAKQAARKLTFFRLAFGAAGGAARIDAAAIKQAAGDYMEDQKAVLDWQCSAPDMPINQAKAALNMMAILSHCLPRGGTVHMHLDEAGARLRANGPRLIVPESLSEMISGTAHADNAREVMASLCAKLLQAAGGTAKVDQSDEELAVAIMWAA